MALPTVWNEASRVLVPVVVLGLADGHVEVRSLDDLGSRSCFASYRSSAMLFHGVEDDVLCFGLLAFLSYSFVSSLG
jgi:hypothetical protein